MGARQLFLCPWWETLDLNQEDFSVAGFTVIKENIAERSLFQDSLIENGFPRPVRLPIPPVYPYLELESFADLRHTNGLIFIYIRPVRRQV